METDNGVTAMEPEEIPFHCSTCGNENPYIIGQVENGANCPECLESESYMDYLIG